MTKEEIITIQYLIDTSRDCIDLKWKLGKYVQNSDLSFLGHNIKELQKKIEKGLVE